MEASKPACGETVAYEYKDIIYPKVAAALDELTDWEVRQDDVVVITYPKSGSYYLILAFQLILIWRSQFLYYNSYNKG